MLPQIRPENLTALLPILASIPAAQLKALLPALSSISEAQLKALVSHGAAASPCICAHS